MVTRRSPARERQLSANYDPANRDIRLLLAGREIYALTEQEAKRALAPVLASVEQWTEVAKHYGISEAEISHMAPAFDQTQREHLRNYLGQ